MPDPLTRLIALTMTQGAPTPAILTRAHTAAYLLGQSERTGVSLAAFKGLSKAERADIKKVVEGQLQYLKGFQEDKAGMSEQAIAARSALYAGAIKATYYTARWGDWELPFVPCDGSSECLGRCLCSASVADNEDGTGTYTWKLGAGASERHCTTCPTRAGDHPVKRRETP